MVRRHAGTGAFRGAHVFPGGRVDVDDVADDTWCDGVDQASRQFPDLLPADAVAFHVCAARELFEEAGVLLARDRSGALVSLANGADRQRFDQYRHDVHGRRWSLREILEREGLRLALDPLTRYAHWVTPPVEGRRFDTRFFVTRVPPSQTAAHDETETTEGGWITAAAALEAAAAGDIGLPPPTWITLRELKPFDSVDGIVAWSRAREIRRREPTLVHENGARLLVMPDDGTRFVFTAGYWRPETSRPDPRRAVQQVAQQGLKGSHDETRRVCDCHLPCRRARGFRHSRHRHARRRAARKAGHDARGLLPHGQRQGGTVQPGSYRDRAAALGRATPRSPSMARIAGSISSKSWTRRAGGCSTRADSRRFTASGKRQPRRNRSTARFRNRCGFPLSTGRRGSWSRSEIRRMPSSEIWTFAIDPADKFIERGARMPAAGSLIKIHEAGDPAEKLDLLVLGDGYTRCRARQVREGREASGRRALSGLAIQGTPEGHQHLGSRAGRRAVRNLAAVAGHSSAVAARYDLRCVRVGALRPDVRESHVPRYRVERTVRRGGDPDQFGDLRRRRDLRALQHRGCRQRVGAVCVRPRVRTSPRRPGGRVLHVGRRLPARHRSTGAVGAQCHGAARSLDAQMARSGRAGHAAAHAVAQGRVRIAFEGHSRTAASDPRVEQA